MELKYTYFAIELWGGVFCFIIAVSLFGTRYGEDRKRTLSTIYTALVGAMLVADSFAWYFRGVQSDIGRASVRAGNFFSFLADYIMVAVFYLYLKSIIDGSENDKTIEWQGIFVYGISIFNVLLLVITQFTGMIYYIDEDNFYHRGFWFSVCSLLIAGLLISFVYVIIRDRERIEPSRIRIAAVVGIMPFIAILIQIPIYGYSLSNIALIFSVVALFIGEINSRSERLKSQDSRIYKQRETILSLQTGIALSQMKPHFLYNALNSIYMLCGTDPVKGQEAISDLSDYLRANIGSMESASPIPIEKELEHVKSYIAIEKLRFPEELDFSIIARASDFTLPPLTLQPLVENSVRHGIIPKGGGIILLTTRETPESYVVTVYDDGMGFDAESPEEDAEGQHIGIRNVRERLKRHMDATMEIHSVKGAGSEITIRIPKK